MNDVLKVTSSIVYNTVNDRYAMYNRDDNYYITWIRSKQLSKFTVAEVDLIPTVGAVYSVYGTLINKRPETFKEIPIVVTFDEHSFLSSCAWIHCSCCCNRVISSVISILDLVITLGSLCSNLVP